jgi:tetratricopeptide (TPR) repeat protein
VLAALSGGECDKLAAVTLVSLGMLAVRRGSPKEAMEVWSRAVSHVAGCEVSDVDSWTPNDVQCATLVASVLMKMGRLSQEMEHVRRAAVLLSRTARDQKSSLEGGGERVLEGEVEAWTTLADLAEQEGDHHEAVRALRRLKLIQDQRDDRNGQEGLRDRSVLLRRLSLALGRTGESSEAIEHIRGAISALEQLVSNHEGWQSEMADLWRSLALLENSRGRLPEALEALQIAKKLHWDEAQDLAIETRIKLAHGGQLNLETNHINQ